MNCKYCEDTGLINELTCPDPDCIVGKAFKTQIEKYDNSKSEAIVVSESDKTILSISDQAKMLNAIQEMKDLVVEAKDNKSSFDILRYRFKDNGLVLLVYGPKENQNKVIERLEQVVSKYKKKKTLSFFDSFKKETPPDKEFSFRKMLNR